MNQLAKMLEQLRKNTSDYEMTACSYSSYYSGSPESADPW